MVRLMSLMSSTEVFTNKNSVLLMTKMINIYVVHIEYPLSKLLETSVL